MTSGMVRRGDRLLRPVGPWSPAVHEYLRYLEAAGFGGSPRVLGTQDHREVLTFVDGDVANDPGGEPGRGHRRASGQQSLGTVSARLRRRRDRSSRTVTSAPGTPSTGMGCQWRSSTGTPPGPSCRWPTRRSRLGLRATRAARATRRSGVRPVARPAVPAAPVCGRLWAGRPQNDLGSAAALQARRARSAALAPGRFRRPLHVPYDATSRTPGGQAHDPEAWPSTETDVEPGRPRGQIADYLFPFMPRRYAAAERISAGYGGPAVCVPEARLKFLPGNTL